MSQTCLEHKRKREICLSQRWKKILTWKYSDQFWYFSHIFLLRYQIDLILMATKKGLEDLKLFSLPKLHNLPFSRPKQTWKMTYYWKTRIDILYFPFWGACVLGFWMLYILKGYKGSHIFGAARKPYFYQILRVFIFYKSLRI